MASNQINPLQATSSDGSNMVNKIITFPLTAYSAHYFSNGHLFKKCTNKI